MLSFKEWLNEQELNESVKKFTDGKKLIEYAKKNELVSRGYEREGQDAEIIFLNYHLRLDEGGIKGVHYWNRHSGTYDISVDLCCPPRSEEIIIQMIPAPEYDANVILIYDGKKCKIESIYGKKVLFTSTKLTQKEVDKLLELEKNYIDED